jgi:hypothetical protein
MADKLKAQPEDRTSQDLRVHYRLNQNAIALAKKKIGDITQALCRRGVYGSASLEMRITDGVISEVRDARETITRIHKRRNGGAPKPKQEKAAKRSSLLRDGRTGDTPEKEKDPKSTSRSGTPPSTPFREGEHPGDESQIAPA